MKLESGGNDTLVQNNKYVTVGETGSLRETSEKILYDLYIGRLIYFLTTYIVLEEEPRSMGLFLALKMVEKIHDTIRTMSIFNYLSKSPYFNPAGEIEKTTNELPAKKKATTKTVKKEEEDKPVKKKRARRTKKAKKNED